MAMTVLTPVVACALTFITFALMNGGKNILSASDIFTTLVLFSALRFPINYVGKLIGKAAQALEACQRIANFLDRDLNPHDSTSEDTVTKSNDDTFIKVNKCSVTVGDYVEDEDNPGIVNKASFTVCGVNFSVKKSQTLAIVGSVGSGKSVSVI